MADDPYLCVEASGLKLKGVKGGKVKKKKKKKDVKESLEKTADAEKNATAANEGKVKKTAAELAFEKSQEKRSTERILKKASKTHKQRVEELNEYLGSLTEHYDIQKVSWTK